MARAKRSKKKTLADLPPEPDPKAPLDGSFLVAALQPLRKDLEKDLLARAKKSAEVTRALKARHAEEKKTERTADDFASWQRRFVEQVAAAWILSCVFVRTLEDRDLLEQRRIAGPGALDAQRTFLQLAPSLSEREYLLTTFREMTRLPAAAALFDDHNPAWMLAPSAEGAKALLQFFRTGGADAPALRFGQPSTRFLGDLYQDLNENVRKRYALLQTPDFVEAFILDRTLEPAIDKFGLDDTDLIDPTCGSGHFLLGAFDRLYERQLRAKPGLSPRQAAELALDKVCGTDINPYAVAIAKFRLTLSFLDKGEYAKLSEAPKLPLHVAVADSLLYNPQHEQTALFHQEEAKGDVAAWERGAFAFEHEDEAREVMHRERGYAAVVGNPPYITVKDKVLRDRYRALYPSAAGKYALSVPFCERFFQLARDGGRVGQITANSFMKREFGRKLIEEYLPTVDLDLIVNTSGAYIPGHGTPTVLLFGAHRAQSSGEVLAVLAKRGEPTTPEDPARGLVWSSIAEHWDEVGFENDFVSVANVQRESLADHPWSLTGGGATKLKSLIEEHAGQALGNVADSIGIASFTLEDDVFLRPGDAWARETVRADELRPMVIGEAIRDWSIGETPIAFFPYTSDLQPVAHDSSSLRSLWPWRTNLANSKLFGGKTKVEGGLGWHEYGRLTAEKLRTPLTITFAFVATHNHFVLDRGGKVFNRTAPIIKLPETATEEDHLALLAYLNSSTAAFYLRQVCHSKGAPGVNEGHKSEEWEQFLEYSGTQVGGVPVPPANRTTIDLGQRLDDLAQGMSALRESLRSGEVDQERWRLQASWIRNASVLNQEELDWHVYDCFGLLESEAAAEHARLREDAFDGFPLIETESGLTAGHRAFEVAMLERGTPTAWFSRNGYETEVADLERRYGAAYCRLLRWRAACARDNKLVGLLESPEYKRRWGPLVLEAEWEDAIEAQQLDRAEEQLKTREQSTRAAEIGLDGLEVRKRRDLLEDCAVPFLAAYRYTESGLEKRAVWERTWDLQRREDADEDVGTIPVPPKYGSKDYSSTPTWRLRGKLDVPKERFVSYPGCESDEDGEPVYGWAGWDHTQRAQALVALYQDRKTREGWTGDRLTPMLAGVLELLPWLKQWHDEPMPEYDTTFFEAYDAFLDTELRDLSLTRDDLREWRPPEKKTRRRT